jgi:hypothetical protein
MEMWQLAVESYVADDAIREDLLLKFFKGGGWGDGSSGLGFTRH